MSTWKKKYSLAAKIIKYFILKNNAELKKVKIFKKGLFR